MRPFWIRFGGYCLLWTLLIVQYSEHIPISILFFTLSLGLYFFLSLRNVSLLLYICLSAVIFVHGLVIDEHLYTVLLLLYVMTFAIFRLSVKHFILYLTGNLALSISLLFLQDIKLPETIILSVFISFLLLSLNQMSQERKEQSDIYDQLLGEYRQLKRMHVAAEREARLEERTRIARDIHDSVGHRLTALIMKLEILAIKNDNSDYRELKSMANESLEETREAVKALQTEESEGIATVVHLIRKLEAESHILVQFTMKQGVLAIPLSNERNVVLYRVIQEALTNAMRHAQSREVQVILGKSAINAISFEITNQIFDAQAFEFGFGLKSMKSRLEEINGRLEVYQTEQQFIVRGVIPGE